MITQHDSMSFARRFRPAARLTAGLMLAALMGGCAGLRGRTYIRLGDGSIGPALPNVALTFVKEDGSAALRTTSDANGRYSMALDAGRYYVLATHVDYEDSTSAPGLAVVNANTWGTANFFLRPPQATTVLVVRHGEKQDPNSNAPEEPLSADGLARADSLRDTALRAGVSAVYATDTKRARDTVAPLAGKFRLPTQVYTDAVPLAAEVLAQHRGDVVLVAAHSNTVAAVANAFGAQVPTESINDFDNLYVVSVSGATTNVVNLQYAADSTPDLTKNDRQAMTLLLVGTVAPAGAPEPQELLHAAAKAGVAAIYTSVANNALIAPLAAALDLKPVTFNSVDMAAFVAQLLSSHAQQTVVVGATNDELRALIRQLAAYPFPILYPNDTDHLLVVTRFVSGAIRVVPLRY